MRVIWSISALVCALLACAGSHTIQRGETFEDVAKLYNIPLDSIIKANPGIEAYAGLTIEVPLLGLVYDLGDSELFRNMRYRNKPDYKKGNNKYNSAHEKQLKLKTSNEKKRRKLEAQIIKDYTEAVSYGNTDALYQLGKQKVHGLWYTSDAYPTFYAAVNSNLEEFSKGIEYLQVAAIVGNNDKALVELALACGYEDSPIRNPYLCLGMLERYQKELGLDVSSRICYMYENGYGILPDLLQAYINCPSAELTDESGTQTHRERIMEKIEAMPENFESARYGVGLDAKTLMSIGLSHYHDDILEPEGIFWLHRAARLNDADANWALAAILQNDNYVGGSMGSSWNKESQMICFVEKAAANGKQEAEEFLEAYKKQQEAVAEQERLRELERQREIEEKKQRRNQMWLDIAGTFVQAAAQVAHTYVAIESAKAQSPQMLGTATYSTQRVPIMQMSDAEWQAKNQLAMQQIAQYTVNKYYADWTGTPMIPTDMSAVDLGTDMSPGSPLWNWGMQQQIHTIQTQNARMSCESVAFYKRQADLATQQLMENPLQPIAGYYDIDGNWISHDMVAAGYNSSFETNASNTDENYSTHEETRNRSKEYYDRYGYKDCHICHGLRYCQTCGGDGCFSVSGKTEECPNCYLEYGKRTGKCSSCQGTGRVYGLK